MWASTGPQQDDYKKLACLSKHLCKMKDLTFTLSVDGSGIVQWWIDASYAVHPIMRGHTGAAMSLRQGAVYSGSWKLKVIMELN